MCSPLQRPGDCRAGGFQHSPRGSLSAPSSRFPPELKLRSQAFQRPLDQSGCHVDDPLSPPSRTEASPSLRCCSNPQGRTAHRPDILWCLRVFVGFTLLSMTCESKHGSHLRGKRGCCSGAQSCPTLFDPTTVARQAPLSLGFSRQEHWSGLPCPPPGDLPQPGPNVLYKPIKLNQVCLT